MHYVKCSIVQTIWERHKAGRYDTTIAVCNECGNSTKCFGSGKNSINACLASLKGGCRNGGDNFYVVHRLVESRRLKGQIHEQVYQATSNGLVPIEELPDTSSSNNEDHRVFESFSAASDYAKQHPYCTIKRSNSGHGFTVIHKSKHQ